MAGWITMNSLSDLLCTFLETGPAVSVHILKKRFKTRKTEISKAADKKRGQGCRLNPWIKWLKNSDSRLCLESNKKEKEKKHQL